MPDIYIDSDTNGEKTTKNDANKKPLKTESEIKTELLNEVKPQLDEKPHEAQNSSTPETEKKENSNVVPVSDLTKLELLDKLGIEHHANGHTNILSSYYEDPPQVKFSKILDHEILLLFLRAHFVTNFPWILKAIALTLIPILFEFLGAFGFYSTSFVSPAGKFIIYGFYYFFILSGYIFVNFMTWFYNISLVSNIRIIDIDFSNVVFENVAATKLIQVEDVNYAQIGVFRSMFDYGDVTIQTAGTASNFEFSAVPHPENVLRIVQNLIGKKLYA